MKKERNTRGLIMKDAPLDLQAINFCAHIHCIFEAIAKAHEEYLGYEIMTSKEVEEAIEQDILQLGIAIGRYDPVLKDYLEYHWLIHPYRDFWRNKM